jgi:hypothetical protein
MEGIDGPKGFVNRPFGDNPKTGWTAELHNHLLATMTMAPEVFVQSNGELFSAWDVEFTQVEQHRETAPCTYYEPDGSVRKGTMVFTIETAQVSFCASVGAVRVGLQGQLSSTEDRFYEVTISSAEPEQEHIRVVGKATRKVSVENDR